MSEKKEPEKKGEEDKSSSSPIAIARELEECEKKKDEYLAGWQRARADFINYKKEELERIGELLKYVGEEMILKILPLLDNFEAAEKNLPQELKGNENIKGILQLKNQILDLFKKNGVEEIKTKGEKFDPNFHEAVETVEAKDLESGTILEETQKGYKINGKLIRPAKVKVAK